MLQDICAAVEDYDSDQSSAVPGTLVQAKQASRCSSSRPTASSRTPKAIVRQSQPPPPPPASDSGYSSHSASLAGKPSPSTERAHVSAQRPVQPRTSSNATPTKSRPKPVIHRIDSAQNTTKPASTIPETVRCCSDPNCVDPNCERRYTLPQQQNLQPHYGPPAPTYQQPPSQYPSQYAQAPPSQMQTAAQLMPPPPAPRPRTGSMSRRPVSIHGYSSMSYNGAQHGPPPALSAYYTYNQQQQQPPLSQQPQYPPQHNAYLPPMPATPSYDYAPQSPALAAPQSPSLSTYPGFPGQTTTYSARQGNPTVPGLEMPKPLPAPGLPSRNLSLSARGPDERRDDRRAQHRKSIAYREPESAESYSESATSETESDSEEEWRREQLRRRNSRRNSRAIEAAPVARRPSIGRKPYTDTVLPKQARREPRALELPRSKTSHSDTAVDSLSSSEIGDSDRTARAVLEGRRRDREYSSSKGSSSRRPSVSTTASSARTKGTSLSSGTEYSKVILEGPNGRRTAYLSKDGRDELTRQYQRQKLEDDQLQYEQLQYDKVAAYQKNVSGGEPYELTAENIRQAASTRKPTPSRVSGRSQKSSGSGSKVSKSDGIRIQSGETVLHVYGDAKIEMRASEDGGPATFVVASSTNGRDSTYQSSTMSSSRLGRSRGRSDDGRRRHAPREENIHEGEYEMGC